MSTLFVAVAITVAIASFCGVVVLCLWLGIDQDKPWHAAGIAVAALFIGVFLIVLLDNGDGYHCVQRGQAYYNPATKVVTRDCIVKIKDGY